MRRVVYISTAPGFTEAELDRMLQAARNHNAAHAITGFLIYNGRNFLQLIEGDDRLVEELMRRIEADDRHSGVVRLIDEGIAEKGFAEWAMNRISLAREPDERRRQLAVDLPDLDQPVDRLVRGFALLN